MARFSRRQLAHYAVEQLLAGSKPANISQRLAAAWIVDKKQKEADLLLDDIAQELENRGLLARVVVTSVSGLSSELRKRLSLQIKKAANVDEVALSEQIDPSVIGGLRVETTNHTWDRTIARYLAEIKGGI